ncbi:hypothetical protein ACLMJK_004775 [Lecanora helva]
MATQNPPSIGYQLTDTNVITIVFAIIAVIARVFTKIYITRNTGWDDYTVVIALCIGIGRTVNDAVGVNEYGMGRHQQDLRPDQIDGLLTSVAVDTSLYFLAIAFAKLAILIFIYRIFSIDARFRWTCRVFGAIICLLALLSTLLNFFACSPVAARYTLTAMKEHPNFQCVNIGKVILVYGWFNTFTDFIELLLPMPLILGLQMMLTRKLGLAVVFASGAFVCGVSVYRLYVLYTNDQSSDGSWLVIESKIWLSIEVNLAIITACLPTFPALFRSTYQTISSSMRTGSSRSKPTSFAMQRTPQAWSKKREYSPSHMDTPLSPSGRRSDSEVEQGSEGGREVTMAAMYPQRNPHREYAAF